MYEKHLYSGTILTRIKDLFGNEIVNVEWDLGLMKHDRLIGFEVILIDRRRYGKTRKRIEYDRVFPFTHKTANTPKPGKTNFLLELACRIKNIRVAGSILQVRSDQFATYKADVFEFFLLCRNNIMIVRSIRRCRIDEDEAVCRGVFIGHQQKLVSEVIDHTGIMSEFRDERLKLFIRTVRMFPGNEAANFSTFVNIEDKIFFVFRNAHRECALRVVTVFKNKGIGGLWRTQFVIINFLEIAACCVLAGGWSIVTSVEKAIFIP